MEEPILEPSELLSDNLDDAHVSGLAKVGFWVGVAYDWSNTGAFVIANTAKYTYLQTGGWSGVAIAAIAASSVGASQQYPTARCANTVANSRGRVAEWFRHGWVGRKFGVEDGEEYIPMGHAKTASTAFLLGSNAVVLKDRILAGATHEEGKESSKRAAAHFAVTVGFLAALGAGSSEVANMMGNPEVADQIIDTMSNPYTWMGILGLSIIYDKTKGVFKRSDYRD